MYLKVFIFQYNKRVWIYERISEFIENKVNYKKIV